MRKKITVSVAEDRCFFHVFGDSYKYFDLQYLQINHPDLRDYCEKNKLELQSVRRHIVVGANCILFSVYRPTRLCRIGTYRRF